MAETVIFRALVLVTILAPIPFGANRPWAWSLLAAVLAVLVAAAGAAGLLPLRRFAGAAAAVAAVAGWMAVQAGTWTPAAWHHPAWALVPAAAGAVSLEPEATVTGLMRLLAYAAAFWLAAGLGRDRHRAWSLVRAVVLTATACGAYGLMVHVSEARMVLWFDKWAYADDVTGPFVNRNAFATYLGLGLVGALALVVRAADRPATVMARGAPWIVAVLVLGTALLLTHSRGGVISAAIGCTLLFAAAAAARSVPRRAAATVAVGAVLAAVVGWAMAGQGIGTRLGGTSLTALHRDEVWALTVDAIAERPWLGTGAGTFEAAFRRVRDDSVGDRRTWNKAHDVYLENALELGIPAAFVLTGLGGWMAVACARGVRRRRRDGLVPAIGLAASGLVGVHGVVDFGLQIPAVTLTWLVLAGAGLAQAQPRPRPPPPAGAGEPAAP